MSSSVSVSVGSVFCWGLRWIIASGWGCLFLARVVMYAEGSMIRAVKSADNPISRVCHWVFSTPFSQRAVSSQRLHPPYQTIKQATAESRAGNAKSLRFIGWSAPVSASFVGHYAIRCVQS